MCYSPSNRDMELYEEARRAYKAGDLSKLRDVYNKMVEENVNPEILYVVRKMVDDLEKKAQATQQ
ncbi:MAG: hypothetical protein GSR78_02725 [Desulfurococcales archaeon]|nr:hypothetical protein [Desulfurococcales archaeon]